MKFFLGKIVKLWFEKFVCFMKLVSRDPQASFGNNKDFSDRRTEPADNKPVEMSADRLVSNDRDRPGEAKP